MTKKMAAGGMASSFRDMTAGSGSGLGRLQKTSIAAKTKTQKLKVGGMVKGYADGGPMTMDEIIAANMKRNRGFKMAPGYEASARMGMEKQEADTSPERLAYNARQAKREAAAKRAATIKRNDKNAGKMLGGIRKRENRAAAQDILRQGGEGPDLNTQEAVDLYADYYDAPAGRIKPQGATSGTIMDMPEGDTRKMKRGGMTKMAKGGKAEAFEGSAMDMAQDKKLAKKYGMSKKDYEKSPIDAKHDKQRSMKGLKKGGVTCGGMAMGGYASGGMSTAQDGMKGALRPKPTAMAKGGKVTFGSMQPLPGTKTVGPIRPTTATGASMKKDGMKGQLRAKASGAKPTNMMKPLGMTKMASGGKVRGAGCAQRGTKFIGEV